MVKRKYINATIILVISGMIGFGIYKHYPYNDNFQVAIFKIGNGYGYSILKNDKTFIKQSFIPAIQTKKAFCSIDDAQKTANLVEEKIKHQLNPRITIKEMKKIGIHFNCSNVKHTAGQ